MTLLEIERLIRKISDVLAQGINSDAAARLAEDYAAVCHAVNLRLQQCEAMIRADDRHQAIQLAETAPNLLALIRVVEFRNAADWRAFCQQNALAQPERIDARAVEALNQCYAQGISTDHPLYAAYRKAILNRNDEEALDTLRSIVRLNPSDANASAELTRVDAKVLAGRLNHLALANGDAARVVAEVESIESHGFKTRPEGEVWRQATMVRCRVLLEAAAKARAASQWSAALAKLELIRRLQKELGLEFSAEELHELKGLEKWTAEEKEKDRRNREFAALLSELHRRIHESEEKDTSARYVELPEMRADFEALHKAWRALTDFTRPIPEDATVAFRKRSALLEAEIARRLAVRRRVILAGTAIAVLLCAAVAWLVLRQMKAHQFARELENAVSEQQTRAAEHLLATLQTSQKSLLHAGVVNVAVADAETFVAKERGLLTNFETAFAQLPNRLDGEPDAARVNALGNQFAQTRAALNALSPDLKAENEPRVGAFEQQWQQYLSRAAVAANNSLNESVMDAEKQAAQLDYRAPVETASKQLAALSGVVKKIDECEAGFTNHFALRSDLIERAAAVQARSEAYEKELKKLDSGMFSLKQARAFADFSTAINSMASSEFSSAPAAAAATAVQSLGASEETVLRSLLNATNPATWAFIKKGGAPTLIPQIAMPVERSLFQQLEADPATGTNHQRYRFWLDPNGTRRVEWITAGALDSSPGWKQIQAWTVSPDATSAAFTDHDYGYFNGQWRLSRTQPIYRLDQTSDLKDTAALSTAELGKVWAGGDTYARPLLQALDAVKDSEAGSPIFRAYLFCQLVDLMKFQPDEWGLSFCPSAPADAARIRDITGGKIASGDWFVPVKTNAWNARLQQFFAGRKSVSYLKQAAGNLTLAQAAARDGLRYAGFVGLAGNPVVTAGGASGQLFGYAGAGREPAQVSGSGMPLSPLFTLTVPRANYLADAGVDPNAPTFATGLLPLFRGKN
jgi:hypothetical protein